MTEISLGSRYRGCVLGLAAGDAVDTTLEFTQLGAFTPITDLVGGGPFKLRAGQWTDDTSMALCLATSLVETQKFDAADQMHRYVRWWREGYFSSTGECFDIGNTTRAALQKFEVTGEPLAGSEDPNTAGNGSLMRLAPVPLAFRKQPELAVQYAAESSRTTHGAPQAVDAEGFVPLNALAQIVAEHTDGTLEEILQVFEHGTDTKKRFEIRGEMVRARYGHSQDLHSGVEYPPAEPPETLYHGTNAHALASIRREGLRAMNRQYVHLSTTPARAKEVAGRRTRQPVLLIIRALAAHHAGVIFHAPEPLHFLARAVPVEFIEFPQ